MQWQPGQIPVTVGHDQLEVEHGAQAPQAVGEQVDSGTQTHVGQGFIFVFVGSANLVNHLGLHDGHATGGHTTGGVGVAETQVHLPQLPAMGVI